MKEVRDQVSSVHERQRAESDEDAQVEEISRNGYTVIQDVLTEDELSFLHTGVIEKIYKQLKNNANKEAAELILRLQADWARF